MTDTTEALAERLELRFVEKVGASAPAIEESIWPPLLIPKDVLQAEIDRLCSLLAPANGRYRSLVVHPLAEEPGFPGFGLVPGIHVVIEILLPGKRTAPIRHNSSLVNFSIEGRGTTVVVNRHLEVERFDVWYAPALTTYDNLNETDRGQVKLVYSNAVLLEKLRVHFVDEHPPEQPVVPASSTSTGDGSDGGGLSAVSLDGGAQLMPYEQFVNPPVVEHHAPRTALAVGVRESGAREADGARRFLPAAAGFTSSTTRPRSVPTAPATASSPQSPCGRRGSSAGRTATRPPRPTISSVGPGEAASPGSVASGRPVNSC